jgi:hypothetical protein
MKQITSSRRIREIWAELGYAQRLLLEIRTGIPLTSSSMREAETDYIRASRSH